MGHEVFGRCYTLRYRATSFAGGKNREIDDNDNDIGPFYRLQIRQSKFKL